MSARNSNHTGPLRRRDLAVAAACGVFVATMVASSAGIGSGALHGVTTGWQLSPIVSFSTGAPGLRLSLLNETQKVLGRVAESK